MAPIRNSESIPAGFETLPVYAEGEVIPGASPKGVLGAHGIRAFRHIAAAVRFVVFSAPGPLVSSTIIVGTEPISDAGHPHTLEHIIFLGSKMYPDRGYLDNLACRCISDGTNAWTDNEYTAYTATTAGLEGFLNLLPCYLDHIMRPKINRPAFDSEVYHIREDGKEAGVVFCEMQAREHTEADLAELALQRLLYKKTPLAFGCGGICKDIRNLTNEDIAQFHRNQYCGANISVCVGGSDISAWRLLSSVKPLLDEMASMPGFHPGVPRWQIPIALEPLPPVTRQIVPFPSSDESIGSITIAWRGPGVVNKSMRTAVDVMLRYLASDVWSPLRQAFVEVEDQIASDIEALQETFLDMGSFMLSFEGVSHMDDDDDDDDGDDEEDEDDPMEEIDLEEEETRDSYLISGKLEKKLMKILQDIVTSGELPGGLDAVHVAIKKEKESLVSEFEAGSHNSVPHHLIEELIYGERGSLVIGEEARGLIGQYDAVKQKDETFWISILKDMFVDAPRIELVLVPEQQLAEKLAEDEQKSVNERVRRIGKDALETLGRENKERIASLKTAKFKASSFPPIPSTMSITRFPYSVSRHTESRFYLAQSVALETDFVHCAIMFDSKRLTMDQRMLLPLLAELIPTCDVLLDDMTYVQYTDNARAVSEVTISNYESTVSIGLSYGLAEQCVVVHFTAAPESFERAAQLILRTFFQSEITAERVAAVSQSLLANCLGELREGESVLNAAAALVPYCETQNHQHAEKLPNSILYNFVAMYPFVSFLSDEFSSAKKPKKRVRQKVIHKMHDVLKHVRSLPPSEIMVQISARDPQSAHKLLETAWEKNAVRWDSLMTNSNNSDDPNSKMEGVVPAAVGANFATEDCNEGQLPISRRLPARLSDLAHGQVLARVIGIGGVESSFLECRKDCDVFVGHSDWGALNVLIEMLSRVEGPLSDAVRVAGLAYGVHIQFSTWTGVIYVSIHESSSLAAAWDAVCNCLTDFRAQLETATTTTKKDGVKNSDESSSTLAVELDTAKASMLFTLNKSRASPGSISVGALSRAAIDAPASPAADQELEAEVEKVSLDCLKRVFDAHVKPLYTADQGRVVVAVCGDSVVADIVEKFASCSHPVRFEECSTEDLYPKVVRSFVKSLRK